MFLYMKTNILRGLGIFKIDFPVVTNQLIHNMSLVPVTFRNFFFQTLQKWHFLG